MGCHLRSTSLGHGRLLLPKGYLLASKNLLGWSRLRSSRAGLASAGLAAAVLVVVDDLLAATGVLNFLVNDLAAVEVAVVLGLAIAVVAFTVRVSTAPIR